MLPLSILRSDYPKALGAWVEGRGPSHAPVTLERSVHVTPRARRRLVALSAMARSVCAASRWATPVRAIRLDAAGGDPGNERATRHAANRREDDHRERLTPVIEAGYARAASGRVWDCKPDRRLNGGSSSQLASLRVTTSMMRAFRLVGSQRFAPSPSRPSGLIVLIAGSAPSMLSFERT
jgi:hypothetical protein